MTTISKLAETAAELGKDARDTVDQLGQSAGKKLDEVRSETGGALHSAASSVRQAGRQSSKVIGNMAADTANRLDATGSYVEDHNLKGACQDLGAFGSRHIAGSLAIAAAIGFLAGTALSRFTHSCSKAAERA